VPDGDVVTTHYFVSDIAVFVQKRNAKLQPTNYTVIAYDLSKITTSYDLE